MTTATQTTVDQIIQALVAKHGIDAIERACLRSRRQQSQAEWVAPNGETFINGISIG